MYYLEIALIFFLSCSFPAALISAIRAEDPKKAAGAKLWACLSFGILMLLVF